MNLNILYSVSELIALLRCTPLPCMLGENDSELRGTYG